MLTILAIQRDHLGWDGDPNDWIPLYVQRDSQTLVIPRYVSVSLVPQSCDPGSVYGCPVLVHTNGAGSYPMTELDFVKSGDEKWIDKRHAEVLACAKLIDVNRNAFRAELFCDNHDVVLHVRKPHEQV